jgi:hypothetical protein
MNLALNDLPTKDVAADPVRQANDLFSSSDGSTAWRDEGLTRMAAVLLALLPGVSFLGQLWFSYRAGTQEVLYHHLTVMIVDWVFVPFNFFVVRVIEWRRGGRLYLIACISVMLNVLTHAFWQYNDLDAGHMITKAGVFLPAGWVHLVFSIVEMELLVAFVFCRKAGAPALVVTTILATTYFLTMGTCGYIMHHAFIASDVIAFVCGLFFTLVYPQMIGSKRAYR